MATAYHRKKRPELKVVDKLQSLLQLSNRLKMLSPMKEDIVLRVRHCIACRSILFFDILWPQAQ